ncbi:hypothetical protein AYL99_03952 [Fonsecaea erecta]|uniref:Uncharacterized protein n=1 Tax=Fonsecaea erecta TaxID=1367422 RepID=A0A178ZPK9_9EURO|nr:hypothetical protein AYL99_03952 [Fonsecaea erecta]OAP61749.1 hypothetical protein AYL99_03952 [Fonsecaea erecta]
MNWLREHQENLGIPCTIQFDSPGSIRTPTRSATNSSSSGSSSSSTNTSSTTLTWPVPSPDLSDRKRKARSPAQSPGDDEVSGVEGLGQFTSARRASKRRTRSLLAPWSYFDQADDNVNDDNVDEDSDYIPDEAAGESDWFSDDSDGDQCEHSDVEDNTGVGQAGDEEDEEEGEDEDDVDRNPELNMSLAQPGVAAISVRGHNIFQGSKHSMTL